MPDTSLAEVCVFTWAGERQLVPVYEKFLTLASQTDSLEEATELVSIQREQIGDCTELLSSLEVESTGGVLTITIPEDFDAILVLIHNQETTLLEDGYLRIDPHVSEPVARGIIERVTRRQARQLTLLKRIAEKRGIELPRRVAPPGPPAPAPTRIEYIVQPGDTMFLIARRFGVPLEALIRANPQIRNPDVIVPGEVIVIPRGPAVPPEMPPGPPEPVPGRRYIVREGDTMFSISQRFGVSLSELVAFNPQIRNPNQIIPGQVVFIPAERAVG
ncbi:MAG: LysM peptidoglycan-binding domain-containing protein [Candidatus Fermentithermobacillus carboniphilus]|uniref:LysM peptidoglycan-binding domain-containing protein n=1 Tax=Candidatus Fermentithermobacillus carboniphilus TaxID=3085328 RepID=A0AAT9LEU0_9FIRM|nr:MAG: LysM peptidoglycan-binding domain-containing protein [Candidatus Fermentithermobacillus carboniphilus]